MNFRYFLLAALALSLLTVIFLVNTTSAGSVSLALVEPVSAGANPNDPTAATLYYWAQSLGGAGTGISTIARTYDGGLIAAGCNSCNVDQAPGWLIRYRRDGSIAWQKNYGYAFSSIVQTNDGGFLLAIDEGFSTEIDAKLIKIDAAGQVIWQKQYGDDSFDVIYDVETVGSGGFVTVGLSLDSSSEPGDPKGDIWVMRLREDGSTIWQKNYGLHGNDWGYQVKPTRDNGFIIVGERRGFAYLLKLNGDGSVAWNKLYGETGEPAYAVAQTPDGGFAFTGLITYISDYSSKYGAWVVKVNKVGNIEWQKRFFDYECSDIRGRTIRSLTDGTLWVAGSSCDGIWTMALTAADGAVKWQKYYGGDLHYLTNIVQTGGGMALAGNRDDEAYILKLNAEGEITDCPLINQGTLEVTDTTETAQSSTPPVVNSTTVQSAFAPIVVTDTAFEPDLLCQAEYILGNSTYLPLCTR